MGEGILVGMNDGLDVKSNSPLGEDALDALESCIPELAVDALRHAYLKALTTSGSVVEAIDGKLVRTYANGARETLKELSERPTPSRIGARMVRKQTV